MKRNVIQRDLLNFYFLSSPRLSPEGGCVAYRVSRACAEKNGYESDIWEYDFVSGTNRKITTSGAEKFFCWSTDGKSLIFASDRPERLKGEAPAGKRTCFYAIPTGGGEAEKIFELPYAVQAVRALCDDRFLILATFEPGAERGDNPEKADMMIFDQIPFMANGKGYTGQNRTGLGVYSIKNREFLRLTPDFLDVERFSLSPDGTQALIVGREYKYVRPLSSSVWKLDISVSHLHLLSGDLNFTFLHADWLGGSVVVTGTDRKTRGVSENPKFYVLEDGRLKCLTPELDNSLANTVTSDSHYGCAELAGAFFPYNESLICCATDVMKSRLCTLSSDGRLRSLTFGTSAVVDYSVGNGRAVFVAYEGLYPTELYLMENGQEKRLTAFNRPLFDTLNLSQPIHVTVDNGEGLKLDGWYMKPAGFRSGEKYPAVLHIHGGPKAAFGDVYHHEMQCWAAEGYAVIYCNPRGGDGRGGAFADIRGHYGEQDYRDIMAFTEWCVENLDFIDGARLGVTGGSYGGFMTNWIITHTDRFRAAVSQRGISNWVSKYGGCDIGHYYVQDQHLGTPWNGTENLWRESPLKYVESARTPVLFIHSEEDFRCELNQAFQMFTALKALGTETRLCVFRGENHELSRSGKPRNRLARLREILGWLQSHL